MSTGYYQKNKKGLQKEACERYQSLSEDEKGKKQKYGRERYKNLSEKKTNSLNFSGNHIEFFHKMKSKG